VIYTHGGFRHFVDITRLISDEAARAIAAKGGVIGLQFGNGFHNPKYFKWQFNAPLVSNISTKLEQYAGMSIEQIDVEEKKDLPFMTKPGSVPEEYHMSVDQLASVIDYGVKLVGEDHISLGSDFDGGPLLPREMKDASDYGEIIKALRRLGYGEERIKKIVGGNLLRVIRVVTE
jgi:membrane dipeptidase